MKYKYKVITLNDYGNHTTKENMKVLDEWFRQGWEYVNTIQQNGYAYSAVGVVLRISTGENILP